MLLLVKICLRTQHWFPARNGGASAKETAAA
jgi:hypothetical protein